MTKLTEDDEAPSLAAGTKRDRIRHLMGKHRTTKSEERVLSQVSEPSIAKAPFPESMNRAQLTRSISSEQFHSTTSENDSPIIEMESFSSQGTPRSKSKANSAFLASKRSELTQKREKIISKLRKNKRTLMPPKPEREEGSLTGIDSRDSMINSFDLGGSNHTDHSESVNESVLDISNYSNDDIVERIVEKQLLDEDSYSEDSSSERKEPVQNSHSDNLVRVNMRRALSGGRIQKEKDIGADHRSSLSLGSISFDETLNRSRHPSHDVNDDDIDSLYVDNQKKQQRRLADGVQRLRLRRAREKKLSGNDFTDLSVSLSASETSPEVIENSCCEVTLEATKDNQPEENSQHRSKLHASSLLRARRNKEMHKSLASAESYEVKHSENVTSLLHREATKNKEKIGNHGDVDSMDMSCDDELETRITKSKVLQKLSSGQEASHKDSLEKNASKESDDNMGQNVPKASPVQTSRSMRALSLKASGKLALKNKILIENATSDENQQVTALGATSEIKINTLANSYTPNLEDDHPDDELHTLSFSYDKSDATPFQDSNTGKKDEYQEDPDFYPQDEILSSRISREEKSLNAPIKKDVSRKSFEEDPSLRLQENLEMTPIDSKMEFDDNLVSDLKYIGSIMKSTASLPDPPENDHGKRSTMQNGISGESSIETLKVSVVKDADTLKIDGNNSSEIFQSTRENPSNEDLHGDLESHRYCRTSTKSVVADIQEPNIASFERAEMDLDIDTDLNSAAVTLDPLGNFAFETIPVGVIIPPPPPPERKKRSKKKDKESKLQNFDFSEQSVHEGIDCSIDGGSVTNEVPPPPPPPPPKKKRLSRSRSNKKTSDTASTSNGGSENNCTNDNRDIDSNLLANEEIQESNVTQLCKTISISADTKSNHEELQVLSISNPLSPSLMLDSTIFFDEPESAKNHSIQIEHKNSERSSGIEGINGNNMNYPSKSEQADYSSKQNHETNDRISTIEEVDTIFQSDDVFTESIEEKCDSIPVTDSDSHLYSAMVDTKDSTVPISVDNSVLPHPAIPSIHLTSEEGETTFAKEFEELNIENTDPQSHHIKNISVSKTPNTSTLPLPILNHNLEEFCNETKDPQEDKSKCTTDRSIENNDMLSGNEKQDAWDTSKPFFVDKIVTKNTGFYDEFISVGNTPDVLNNTFSFDFQEKNMEFSDQSTEFVDTGPPHEFEGNNHAKDDVPLLSRDESHGEDKGADLRDENGLSQTERLHSYHNSVFEYSSSEDGNADDLSEKSAEEDCKVEYVAHDNDAGSEDEDVPSFRQDDGFPDIQVTDAKNLHQFIVPVPSNSAPIEATEEPDENSINFHPRNESFDESKFQVAEEIIPIKRVIPLIPPPPLEKLKKWEESKLRAFKHLRANHVESLVVDNSKDSNTHIEPSQDGDVDVDVATPSNISPKNSYGELCSVISRLQTQLSQDSEGSPEEGTCADEIGKNSSSEGVPLSDDKILFSRPGLAEKVALASSVAAEMLEECLTQTKSFKAAERDGLNVVDEKSKVVVEGKIQEENLSSIDLQSFEMLDGGAFSPWLRSKSSHNPKVLTLQIDENTMVEGDEVLLTDKELLLWLRSILPGTEGMIVEDRDAISNLRLLLEDNRNFDHICSLVVSFVTQGLQAGNQKFRLVSPVTGTRRELVPFSLNPKSQRPAVIAANFVSFIQRVASIVGIDSPYPSNPFVLMIVEESIAGRKHIDNSCSVQQLIFDHEYSDVLTLTKFFYDVFKVSKSMNLSSPLKMYMLPPIRSPSPFEVSTLKSPGLLLLFVGFLGDPVVVSRMKMVNKFCKRIISENEHLIMRDAVRSGGISMNMRPSFWLWVTLEKCQTGISSTSTSFDSTPNDLFTLAEIGRTGPWHGVIKRDVTRAFGNMPPHKTGAKLRADSIVRALVTFGQGRLIKRGVKGGGISPPPLSIPTPGERKSKLKPRTSTAPAPWEIGDNNAEDSDTSVTPTDTVSDWGGVSPVASFASSIGDDAERKIIPKRDVQGDECDDNQNDDRAPSISRGSVEDLALSGNLLTQEMKTKLQKQLELILHGLAAKHEDVGYCQGMDYIVAHLLRVLQDTVKWKAAKGMLPPILTKAKSYCEDSESNTECLLIEEAVFRVMDCLFTTYNLRHIFWPELRSLKVCCRVFEKLVQQKLPVLADHFEHHELNVGLFALGWFQTLFLYLPSMPTATVCHIWDIWLVERSYKIFFRVGIAILFLSQPILLNHDLEGMMTYLNTFPDATLLNPDILIACALQIKVTNRMLEDLEAGVGSNS